MDENVVEWFNKGVFQYYIFSETDKSSSANDSKVIGRCRNCRLPTSISGRRNVTSNFIKHLKVVICFWLLYNNKTFIRHSGRTQKYKIKKKTSKNKKNRQQGTDEQSRQRVQNTCIQKVQKYTLFEQTSEVSVNKLLHSTY